MQTERWRLDKVVNKAKAQREAPGPGASFMPAIKEPRRGEAGKEQAVAWLPPLVLLARGVPDASLQSACLCGSRSIVHSFSFFFNLNVLVQRLGTPHAKDARPGKDRVPFP